jgi:hypothetical protein
MSTKRPVNISIKRLQGDTYPEKFSVVPMPANATSVVLNVEGLGQISGTLDLAAKTMEFPVTNSSIASGAVASYDYDIVITAGGTTRTLVEGTWNILARAVP